jgi:hypothetical protein
MLAGQGHLFMAAICGVISERGPLGRPSLAQAGRHTALPSHLVAVLLQLA